MAARKKLTQRQYLNVMTITVAFMILIFVIIGKIMEDKTKPTISTQPFTELTQITLGDWQVVKRQNHWHQQPRVLNNPELHQFLNAWQQLTPFSWTNQIEGRSALTLKLEIAGEIQEWHLLLTEQPLLKLKHAQQAIVLTKHQVSFLFPEKLLRSQVE